MRNAQIRLTIPLEGGEALLFDASSDTIALGKLKVVGLPLESVYHLFVTHRHFDHMRGFAPC